MSRETVKILGVDTSLRSTGFGIISVQGQNLSAAGHGVIRNVPALKHSECIRNIYDGIMAAIQQHRPAAAAVEGIFFHKNPRTSMVLGQARGAVLLACTTCEVPLYEYSPRQVKQAVVGTGAAQKDQVGLMICRLLGIREAPPEDAADALAIAITHAHRSTGSAASLGESI